MNYKNTENLNNYQKTEVSKMKWFDIDECRKTIRPYNLEKINLIENVNNILTKHNIFMV